MNKGLGTGHRKMCRVGRDICLVEALEIIQKVRRNKATKMRGTLLERLLQGTGVEEWMGTPF